MSASPERRAMLAKVHMARKALRLDEPTYRDLVARVTGHGSAADASDAQLHRLLGEFRRLGWSTRRQTAARPDAAQLRKVAVLWRELGPYLADPTEQGLRAFVRRMTHSPVHPDGVDAVEFLDGRQAARVIEALKAWLERERAKGGAA